MAARKLNREEWLTRAGKELRKAVFTRTGTDVPDFHVSVGFPGGGSRRTRIGECWASTASEDSVAHVFVSPIVAESADVLAVLAHEMVHVATPGAGHGKAFATIAKGIGLTGKMTATTAGPELLETLATIVERLGEYPHAKLNPGGRKKQTTRMLKAECLSTGYTVRLTRKWLDEFGAPICPCCETTMSEA